MSGWNLPQKDEDEALLSIDTSIPEAPPVDTTPPPEAVPMEKTELVDVADQMGKSQHGQDGEKKFQRRKEEGIKSVSPPVDVYEPGFRSDVASALVKYFKEKRREQDRIAALRKKIGLRE